MATATAINLEAAGPGERITFDELRHSLPASWHVAWGRSIPTSRPEQMHRETDFIVVGDHVLFLCEEKHWPGVYSGNSTNWFRLRDGTNFPSPIKQATDLGRKLSSLIKSNFPEVAKDYEQYNRTRGGVAPLLVATPHVILSEPTCRYDDVADLRIPTVCSSLDAVVDRLVSLDAEHAELTILQEPDVRARLVAFLDGFDARPPRTKIGAYEILERLPATGNVTTYLARHDAGAERLLVVMSLSENPDPAEDERSAAERETKALQVLSETGVTPKVYDYFFEDDYRTLVVPMDPVANRESIASLLSEQATPPSELFLEMLRQSFEALMTVHAAGVLHRNLAPDNVWLPTASARDRRVFLTGFSVARVVGYDSISKTHHPGPTDAPYTAPELLEGLEYASPRSDVYSLAACMISYLTGSDYDSERPDSQRVMAELPPAIASTLAAAVSADPEERPDPEELVRACKEQRALDDPRCDLPVDFEVEAELGAGATARTFRAVDRNEIERAPRALKVFAPNYPPERIRHEVTILEALSHECIVRFFYAGGRGVRVDQPDTCPYLVYEYLEGQTLESYTRDARSLDSGGRVSRYRNLLVGALDALEHVHQRYVHRDIKPRNLYVHQREDGSERLVILDFGQAAEIGATGLAGTPFFTDLLIESAGSRWGPVNDLYALASSFFYSLTGLLPYERDQWNQPDKRQLLGPVGDDEGSRVFQQRLLRAMNPDPALRYQSAAEFRRALQEPIQLEVPAVPRSRERRINENVDELRKYYRNSTLGNGANRGLGGDYGEQTYVATLLDDTLMPSVLAGDLTLVLFAGNPGDGKTTFLEKLLHHLKDSRAEVTYETQGGWEAHLEGRRFTAVNDASASVGHLSADDYVVDVLSQLSNYDGEYTDFTILVAANDGRLLSLFSENPYFQSISEIVEAQLLDEADAETDSRVRVIDFKARALVNPENRDDSILIKSIRAVAAPALWQTCQECRAQDQCPILFNALSLSADTPGGPAHRLHDQFMTAHLRRQARLTMRDARSVISYGITADLSCEQIHQQLESGENPLTHDRLYFWLLTAQPESPDIGLEQLHELDPDLHAKPMVDRALNQVVASGWDELGPTVLDDATGRPRIPTALFRTPDSDEVNRRRFFFEGDIGGLLDAWTETESDLNLASQFSPYRHLDDFVRLAGGHTDHSQLDSVLVGASRIIGVYGFSGQGLAVRPPSTPGSDSTVVKVFPAAELELIALTNHPYVEHVPDQLVLQDRSGMPRIYISLDTFEILLRTAAGYLPAHPEAGSLLEELKVFARQLMQRLSTELLIVDAIGNDAHVRAQGSMIELVGG